jgi:putative ABC transport system ATP-binding protein
MSPFIRLLDLHKEHRLGQRKVHALRGVNLDIGEGEFVAVMGPSGSGKSTLMNLLGLMDRQTSGRYLLAGQDVRQLDHDKRAGLRGREIGFIFQAFNLLGRSTAAENVELALTYAGHPRKERRRRAAEALARVGLGDRQDHWPGQLSGGEQQRVAIARVLATGPQLILADEPTGSLDSATGREIMGFLQDLNAVGRTIVLVTHDLAVAGHARRIVSMRDGQVVGNDCPPQVAAPATTPGERPRAVTA